jgi:hypothetical protein
MNDLPDFVLIYDGANTSTSLSDYITRVDLGNSVSVNFFSDGTAENPLPLPAILNGVALTGCFAGVIVVRTTGGLQSVLCTQETGMMQTAGNITFQQTGTAATTTDTVNFFSDAEVPEPSALLPLVSMIAGLGIVRFMRCRSESARS